MQPDTANDTIRRFIAQAATQYRQRHPDSHAWGYIISYDPDGGTLSAGYALDKNNTPWLLDDETEDLIAALRDHTPFDAIIIRADHDTCDIRFLDSTQARPWFVDTFDDANALAAIAALARHDSR